MGAGFHSEIQQVNVERVDNAPKTGTLVAPQPSDFQRMFQGDPFPDIVKRILQSAISGDPGSQNELFDKMLESDCHLRCESEKRRMAVTGLEWEIESASITHEGDLSESETKLADEIAQYVRRIVRQIQGLRAGLKHEMDALGRGLSVLEIEWQHIDGQLVPMRLHCIPPYRTRYDYREPWRLRIALDDSDRDGIPVDEAPPGKFIVHAPTPIGGSPIRGGLYRTSAVWWMFKHFDIRFFMKAVELFGQPFRTATYPAGATEEVKTAMLAMLQLMGVSAAGIFPEGSEFTIHDTKMSGSGEWPQEKVIRIANAEISKAWVGATLMTEVSQSGGNRALGEVQNDVREDIRDDDIAAESETITEQLIRPILANSKYRNRLDLLPTFKRVVPEPLDDKADMELIRIAVNELGMSVPIGHVSERFGIPVTEDVDDDAPLPGRSRDAAIDPFGLDATDDTIESANCDRLPCGVHVTAHRALETIAKRRRSSASKLATWIFAAVAASMAHTENVLGAVGEFVSRRRDLATALEDLPEAFDRLPTDEMAALQEHFLLASRMAGMVEARSKIRRQANRELLAAHSDRILVPNAEYRFEAIPFVKAIEALRDRLDLNPADFEALEVEARSRAFRVAAVWDMRLLSDIHRELAASIEAGETARDFKLRLPEMADRNGWTGENPWHADLVQYQNFAASHAAGRLAEMREFGVGRWQFEAYGDSCPICSPLIGKIFLISDLRFYPPLHFWCDCGEKPLFIGEAGDHVDNSRTIDHPAFDEYVAKSSAFKHDPVNYANLGPLRLSTIEPALKPRFVAVAKAFGWEVEE